MGADPRERYWKANLVGAASAMFSVSFGGNVANPFLPIFLHRDLAIADLGVVALWTGLIGATAQGALAISSFVWGLAADRFGRRPMLLRGVIGSATCTALVAATQDPWQLLAVRGLAGVSGGTNPGTVALVAAETPPARLGRALGVLSAARSLGQTAGPALGGLFATALPLRLLFLCAAGIQLLAVAPIVTRVRETGRPGHAARRPPVRDLLRDAPPGDRRALVVLLAVQAATAFASAGSHQLLALRLLELDPLGAALVTGFAFSAASLATVIAAMAYPWALPRTGFRGLTIAAPVLIAAATAVTASTGSLAAIAVAFGLAGLAQGAHTPAMQSMIGLESPAALKSTAFGLSSSLATAGTAVGSVAFGAFAAVFGPAAGLAASAALWLAPAAVLAAWGREPR